MKKLFCLATFLLVASYTQAQFSAQLGLKGGLNVSKLSSDVGHTYESRTGFHAGGYGLFRFSRVGVQPELLLSQQRTVADFGAAYNTFDQEYFYLNIPLMLKFYLAGGLNLQAGPQFGLLVSADGTTLDENDQPVSLNRDALENSDFTAAMGIGWDIPFGISLTARYLLGLSDINEHNFETKNRMFQLSLGFRLLEAGR